MKKICLLAFSGGLDTTYCAKYLQDKNYEIHTITVDTGGFSEQELKEIEQKAYDLGSSSHTNANIVEEFYQKSIKYLLAGNVLKNNSYPLSVSAERMFQAISIAKHAKQINAQVVAHGSTGAGNDQVRFDMAFQIICPDIEIITPIRDQKLSREAEIAFLKEKGIDIEWKKAQYSINQGIWGTSVGGAETLTSHQNLPEEAWPVKVSEKENQEISITFEKGEPVALNDESLAPTLLIQKLNLLCDSYGIGRDVHVGDTIIGIKGRVGFQASGAITLIKAHEQLEKHTIGKWQIHWKKQLADWYGTLLHDGQYLDPVMRDIESFLDSTQRTVSGKVFITLKPYYFNINGIESQHDLMQTNDGVYGEMNNNWTGEDVKGFTKILANPAKIWFNKNKELLS